MNTNKLVNNGRLISLFALLFLIILAGCDIELTDEGTEATFYLDSDGDDYGDPLTSQSATSPPAGYVLDNTDCDDTDYTINPSAVEVCDGTDQDCDSSTAVSSTASAVTANAGNSGDASVGTVTNVTTTINDTWTVECLTNAAAATGTLAVTGATHGLQGTINVGGVFSDPDIGNFPVSGGAPNRASGAFTFPAPADLDVAAREYGAGGNGITLELVNTGPNATINVNVLGNNITVNLGTDGAGAITTTSQDVVDALNAVTAATDPVTGLITVVNNPPTNVGLVTAMSQTALTGGSGVSPGDSFTFTTTAACIE